MDAGEDEWQALLASVRAPPGVPGPLSSLFAPILATPSATDGCMVIGRLAQTLDGRIATQSGVSQWIGGPADLLHTHRLRALCHVVLIGGGTAAADDPQLTTRLCKGPHPIRVVLDADARLPATLRLFNDKNHTLWATCTEAPSPGLAQALRLPRDDAGHLDLRALLAALAARGLTRIFVEGGGVTVSRFLAEGLLDRLHVTVAPIILGSGRPAFGWPGATSIADGLRFAWTVHHLVPDVLFDIALDRSSPPQPRSR